MAVAHVARDTRRSQVHVGRLFFGAVPAAVGLASAVLLLTVAARLAGPPLLRDHASGATLALLGMGVPLEWSVLSGRLTGTIVLSDFPALLIATVVIAATTVTIGWLAARRRPMSTLRQVVVPAAAWFATFSAAAAVVVSHGRSLTVAGVAVRVAVSAPLTLIVGAVWGLVGTSAGVLLARRAPKRRPDRAPSPWLVKAPGAALVATAVTLMGLGACGGGPATLTVATPPGSDRTTAPTSTSTTVAPTTTSMSAPAGSNTTANRSTAKRAGRTAGSGSPTATAPGHAAAGPAASGWAPAAPGVYRYNTSGSTSSLLGKQSFPAMTTLTVDAPAGTRQHSLRELVSPNGDGFVIDQILGFQPEGVTVVRQRLALTQSGDKTVRTLNAVAPALAIPIDTATGFHNEFDLTGSSISGHEVVDLVESTTVPVAGQSVAAVLVRTILKVSGSIAGTIQLDQWWSPSIRVPVKEHLSSTMKSGLVTVKTTYDATLQKLTPN